MFSLQKIRVQKALKFKNYFDFLIDYHVFYYSINVFVLWAKDIQ